MVPITGLYEVAIKVRDLKTAERFYREVLGFNSAYLMSAGTGSLACRRVCRNGGAAGRSRGMAESTFCFARTDSELDRSAALLREKGISVTGPVFHAWIPGRSVYFTDPDGHALELFAQTGDSGTRA